MSHQPELTPFQKEFGEQRTNVKPLRENIGAGDLVTLKSGGPKMVVAERTADKAHCVWHFDNGDSCWQWFPLVVLQVSK